MSETGGSIWTPQVDVAPGPSVGVSPSVPPVHSPNSGLAASEMGRADDAAALAAIEPLGGPTPHDLHGADAVPPPTIRDMPLPAPEDINPEEDYHGRGPAVVGIVESERRRAHPGEADATPDPGGRDFGFEAGRAAAIPVPEHEPLEPEERVENLPHDERPAGPGVMSRLRRALFG